MVMMIAVIGITPLYHKCTMPAIDKSNLYCETGEKEKH